MKLKLSRKSNVIWSENQNFYVSLDFHSHWSSSIWGFIHSYFSMIVASLYEWLKCWRQKNKANHPENMSTLQTALEQVCKKGKHWNIM